MVLNFTHRNWLFFPSGGKGASKTANIFLTKILHLAVLLHDIHIFIILSSSRDFHTFVYCYIHRLIFILRAELVISSLSWPGIAEVEGSNMNIA